MVDTSRKGLYSEDSHKLPIGSINKSGDDIELVSDPSKHTSGTGSRKGAKVGFGSIMFPDSQD